MNYRFTSLLLFPVLFVRLHLVAGSGLRGYSLKLEIPPQKKFLK